MDKIALITDYVWPSVDIEKQVLEKNNLRVIVAPQADESTLSELAKDADAILFCFASVSERVLRSAKRCQVASRYGVGLDNIDIATCTELGIVVTNVPDYCVSEVADHIMAMLLSLNRRIVEHNLTVKSDGWNSVSLDQPVLRTRGSTLGVIGFGRIGRAVARRASAFGMNILAHSRSLQVGERIEGALIVPLDRLLTESDFITICTPLTDETRNMIGKDELAAMKDGAVLINCARGGLIDEEALAERLVSGHLRGAGLDVLAQAPSVDDSPLMKMDNVIITPHTAFFSKNSTEELQRRTAEEAVTVLNGQIPVNLANPEVLGRSRVGI